MRVLTFTSLFPNREEPGHGIFVYHRTAHLAARGHRVVVVAPVPYFPKWISSQRFSSYSRVPQYEQADALQVWHPRYPLLPKVSMPLHGLLMLLGCVRLVRRLHREHRFDCIDAHYVYPDGFCAAILGKLVGIPVVVSARGTDMNLFPKFAIIRRLIRWTLRNAVGGIAVSGPLKSLMLAHGLVTERAALIPNGVDLALFHPVDRVEARQRLGIPLDAEVIVCVAGLVPAKGHHRLLSAIAELAKVRGKLCVYIVGKGPSRKRLEAQAVALGLTGVVSFVGAKPQHELKFWYSAANVSCLISEREGCPNVVLESLSCGVPVVATRVGGIPEIVHSRELGILVDQSPVSIAHGLAEALDSECNRQIIASYGRQSAWESVAEQVEQALAKWLGIEAKGAAQNAAIGI